MLGRSCGRRLREGIVLDEMEAGRGQTLFRSALRAMASSTSKEGSASAFSGGGRNYLQGNGVGDVLAPQPQEFEKRDDDVPAARAVHAAPHPLQLQYWLTEKFQVRFAREFPDYKLQWVRATVHMDAGPGDLGSWCCYCCEETSQDECCYEERNARPDENKFMVEFHRDGTAVLLEKGFHEAAKLNHMIKRLDMFMKKWRQELAARATLSEAPVAVAIAVEKQAPWSCPACTFANNASAAACSACETRRPAL
jgi:hypothetical protein